MNATILLIEDNKDVRENTAEILELAKYKVLTATNGKDGILQAETHLPNLIVSDIMMPEMDGYEVLLTLRKNIATAGIPFIFLTAKSEKSELQKGLIMGASEYLIKPFDTTDLLNIIRTLLQRKKKNKNRAGK